MPNRWGEGNADPMDSKGDVRPSQASHGRNMGGDDPTRDRDNGADRRAEQAGMGASRKEFDALVKRVANMEAFLKEKLEYDPKESYIKKEDEEASGLPGTVGKWSKSGKSDAITRLRQGAMSVTDY